MSDPSSATPLATRLSGHALISQPLLNKGMAFSLEERDQFGLHGIFPPNVATLDEQAERRLQALRALPSDVDRYAFLRDLQDTNETLFYAVLTRHLKELLPVVYTPTVGTGCQQFSELWRKPRGLFLSYPNKDRIRQILADPRYDKVRVIVVSDGERILGLGDQGAGGMGIPIGKLSLYTACAGIHPEQTLPILLDVGTNNPERLANPLYIGWRHPRIGAAEYDDFIEAFVSAVKERWPDVLLQWEDFAGANAGRLLARYRDQLCTFNDDIQGTAAIAAATLLAAIKVTGTPLTEQRIAIFGPGSAGCGIADLLLRAMIDAGLSEAEARARFYLIGRHGLLIDGMDGITPARAPYVQSKAAVAGWQCADAGRASMLEVMHNAQPTVLIGVSGQPGSFDEAIVRAMAAGCARPIIFPLSNPTSQSEATPADLLAWTDGKALIGTGSPFAPVAYGGREIAIDQTNNSYIFPGVGLGVLAAQATRVTDAMFMVAARAVAALSPAATDPQARLLPPVEQLREVSLAVAHAVAQQAFADGVAIACDEATLQARLHQLVWEPVYRPYQLISG